MLFCKQQEVNCECHMQVIRFKSLLSLTGSQKQEQIHYYQGNMCSDGLILSMDLFCLMILFYLLIVSFWLFRQEEKKKSQSGERPMKDERILNLQKKIEEKTMERKKQAGLPKIIPQKTRIVSSKVWWLHKEESNRPAAHRPLLKCQHWQGAEADGAIHGWQ